MTRIQTGWIDEYKRKGALWIHDGNPKRPHALLTSGKHSGGFFNSKLVIPDEVLLYDASSDLLEQFANLGGNVSMIQGVVGPQTGATKLAELLSIRISSIEDRRDCFYASPAKGESGGEKTMLFNSEERSLLQGKHVLLCEDVLTTGGSVDLTIDAVESAGGVIMPFVLVLVNRSGLTKLDGRKIVSLINRSMPMYLPEECPLCKEGSEAIRPKGKEEWARLNATY